MRIPIIELQFRVPPYKESTFTDFTFFCSHDEGLNHRVPRIFGGLLNRDVIRCSWVFILICSEYILTCDNLTLTLTVNCWGEFFKSIGYTLLYRFEVIASLVPQHSMIKISNSPWSYHSMFCTLCKYNTEIYMPLNKFGNSNSLVNCRLMFAKSAANVKLWRRTHIFSPLSLHNGSPHLTAIVITWTLQLSSEVFKSMML